MASVKNSSHDMPNDQTFPLRKESDSSLGSHRRVHDSCHISGSCSATSMNWRGQVCFELSGTPKREGAILGQDAIAVLVDLGGVSAGVRTNRLNTSTTTRTCSLARRPGVAPASASKASKTLSESSFNTPTA